MAQEELDVLLTRMSAIAESVNAFNSKAVQHEAFSALIAAFEGKHHGVKHRTGTEPEHPAQGETLTPPKPATGTAKAKRASKASRSEWGMVKELDLNPVGKASFQNFIEEKNPRSNEDKYPIVVYYLSTVLEIPKITISHIGSIFRLTKSWKEPTNLAGGLGVASSRKGTIDTSSYEDIKITPAGRNFVEHELPRPKAKG
jgi:hypothetical protein